MTIDQTFKAQQRQPRGYEESPVASGFPSPAAGYEGAVLSLDQHLVPRPSATYFCRVAGDAMTAAGIHDGDLLVVDASLTPTHDQVVVAILFGEFVVRRLQVQGHKRWLVAESVQQSPPPMDVSRHETDSLFWGVVTWVLHRP
ncbi:LexA family protein [Marinospirillum alkaliphilum]|uniref:DNA polymerase V n=1 Tax=Marinospirillum alkaliphilum DSM 21637 TaxID=1122209 RepID=A0A1K1XNG5_9GAMM|nr:translesion error-prone DNA polymerase V autoproteolytic subunit [Marinospirillum alkaliphilum]SFX51159.1 DNA polymerase V [Marinospirillum alkaliphilum DSM 21637]